MSHEQHRELAGAAAAGIAVITVSDTRTAETDGGGRLIRELAIGAGHTPLFYRIVPDEPDAIQAAVREAAATDGCQAILLTGGTGISPRDRTPEALADLLEQRLDGYGELFRSLSYAEIGAAALMSRALGGVYQRRLVFAMPGSTAAVRLAMEKLILPELAHLVWEVQRTTSV
ncbi:MAG: MogA/MoaB family molybdenum cofactor biosynthesis protein [Chloroflexi bacterium]|nr:MogA/MoaB family molybdenum cofactor biosynthesis protein [Chloroflexota bacterium]